MPSPGKRSSAPWNTKAYRVNGALLRASTDLCWLCGHLGARTIDHVIGVNEWPRDAYGRHLPGLDAIENLRVAHGTGNRCPWCGRCCNQKRPKRSGPIRPRPRRFRSPSVSGVEKPDVASRIW